MHTYRPGGHRSHAVKAMGLTLRGTSSTRHSPVNGGPGEPFPHQGKCSRPTHSEGSRSPRRPLPPSPRSPSTPHPAAPVLFCGMLSPARRPALCHPPPTVQDTRSPVSPPRAPSGC